jgi:hypothetical protein
MAMTAGVTNAVVAKDNSKGTDLLMALLQDDTGAQTVHTVLNPGCFKALEMFKKNQKQNITTILTLTDPPAQGKALEMHCIKPDGSVWGVNGKVKLPKG